MNPNTLHISLYDLAFLGTIFIGLTFALLLGFTQRASKAANRFLALAVVVMILSIAGLLSNNTRIGTYDLGRNYLPSQFSLAFGPLLYFYVLKLIRTDYKFGGKSLLHFIPVLLQLVVWESAIKPNPVLVFISVAIYLYLSHRAIKRFYGHIAFIHGDRYRHELRWLHRSLIVFGLLWLLWIPAKAVDYYQLGVNVYYPLCLALAVLTIWIAVTAYLRPEAGIETEAPSSFKPSAPAEPRQKGIWLKNAVRTNLYYQDPELSLVSLAEKLDLTTHELSRIINTSLKKSFNDFINEYRVAEVARKMQDPAFDHITLLGIAYDSGFNSRTTFHRIFKQMTGKSPAEYKTEPRKGIPSYNLEHHSPLTTLISYQETTPKWTGKKSNRNVMFKNYFKIAWRNLTRNKSYATINITGLAIGIAACLLIFLVVQYETSFDNFHANKDKIYRILTVSSGPDGVHANAGTPLPLADGLKLDFPQLKQVSSIMMNDGSHYSVSNGDKSGAVKKFKEDLAYYADPQFFKIFNFKWLEGDKNTALAEPNTIVLSRDEADKFFGDWHTAMGKTVRYENNRDLKVTGILDESPVNTDFPMKLAISWLTLVNKGGDLSGNAQDWVSTFSDRNTYIVFQGDVNVKRFNAELATFTKKHVPPPYNKNEVFQLQPLMDMHYSTEVGVYGHHPFSKQLINVISLIGLFLLIIACVNFINLATAQAVNRSKEVGIRKVLGSNRNQLVLQFLSETLIITLFAVVLASTIALVTLTMLNSLLEIHLSGGFLLDPIVVLFLVGVVVGVTFLAGFYPALVLSGYNPIEALRNRIKAGRSTGISLRGVLVVTQFCIAQFLVIGTLVLIYQMNYFRNKSLGFDKDAVITVPFVNDSLGKARVNALTDELMQLPGVKDVSASLYGPSDDSAWHSDFEFNNSTKPVDFGASLKWADPEYFKLYNIRFVAGGPYKKTDTIAGYVINETLMHKVGITDPKQAIGKYIMLWNNKNMKAQITGVVKDFNVGSLKYAIPPVLMASWKYVYRKLNIKIQPANVSHTLALIQNSWNKTFPDGIYEYQFLDKTIADFYKNEDELSALYKIFAGIAIFISCLGLYGMVSFMAVQRTKEVGIRKTLGASVANIVYLFSKEFTLLIIIAFAISAPVGYYLMHQWLQDFIYKITIGPEIFILAILASVAIAWIAVGYKAIQAALANPVKSLRSE